MGRRPPRRRLRLAAAWLGALLLISAGCAPAQVPGGTLADRLNSSLHKGGAAFDDNFATGSAAGSDWFAALSGAAATFRQPDGQTLVVSATVPGDRRPATWTLRVQLDDTGRIQSVAPTPDRPIWALGPVDSTTTTHGTLLSAGLDASARGEWAERLDRAAALVRRASPAGGNTWTGGLVVEVPANGSDFQAITNELPNTASALTACGTGTPRVVVNPLILDQPDAWLDSTLVHEAVHVATDSACVPAGQSLPWAVEGLAESVTAQVYPATAARNRELVVAYLRENPVPTALPATLENLTSYALAQLAVDQVRAHVGENADDLLGRAIRGSGSVTPAELRRVTRWYLSALRRIAATR
ncbi:MAG TPA: hypothetical protein VGK18_14345 [Propionicimonas sp.]|uniref:hypothetical protein n=1 Tax=Propionicimonas sp. TaxID=1955623 RepID=UPI002F426BEB